MEDIREASYSGNLITLRSLVEYQRADVNERHKMNGTTPLHWAVKGGYTNVISYLLSKGADPTVKDNNGVSAVDLGAKSQNSVRALLGLPANKQEYTAAPRNEDGMVASTAFVPLPASPLPLPPLESEAKPAPAPAPAASTPISAATAPIAPPTAQAIVAPPRIPSTFFIQLNDSEDVIEMDFPLKSYAELVYIIFTEYQLDARKDKLIKIRKVPNILIRNDKDVARLTPGTTIQVFTKSQE